MKNKKTASDFFIEHGLAPPSPISGDDESFSNSVSRPEVSIGSGTSAYQSKRRRRSNQIPSQVTAIAQGPVELTSDLIDNDADDIIENDSEMGYVSSYGIRNRGKKSVTKDARFAFVKGEGSMIYQSLIENDEWNPSLSNSERRHLANAEKEKRWKEIVADLRKKDESAEDDVEQLQVGSAPIVSPSGVLTSATSPNNNTLTNMLEEINDDSPFEKPKKNSFSQSHRSRERSDKAERFDAVLAKAEGLDRNDIKLWDPREIFDLCVARFEQREVMLGGPSHAISGEPKVLAFLKSMEHVGKFTRGQSFLCPFCHQQKTTRAGMEYHLIKKVCRNKIGITPTENSHSEPIDQTDDSGKVASQPHEVPQYECPVCSLTFKSSSGAKFHILDKMYCLPSYKTPQRKSSKKLKVSEFENIEEFQSQQQDDSFKAEKAAILSSPSRVTRLSVIKSISRTKATKTRKESLVSREAVLDDFDGEDESLEDAIDELPTTMDSKSGIKSSRKGTAEGGAPVAVDARLGEIIGGSYEESYQRVAQSRAELTKSLQSLFDIDLLVAVKVEDSLLYRSAAGVESYSPAAIQFSSTCETASSASNLQLDFSLGSGPIWALDITVQPQVSAESSIINAFVAVSHHSLSRPTLRPIGSVSSGRNILHFWHISTMSSGAGSVPTSVSTKYYLGVAHDCDTVLDVEWCPHVVPSTSQAGILAAVMGDGVVRIYAVPTPSSISSRISPMNLTHLIPLACCATAGHPATCLRWSRQKPGRLGVGTATGATMVFDIFSSICSDRSLLNSPIELFSAETGFRAKAMSGSRLSSSLRIFANETFVSTTVLFQPPGNVAVRGLSFSPISSPHGLLVCAHSDGAVRLWNDNDGRSPLVEYSMSQRQLMSIDFVMSGTSVIVATENGEISELSLQSWVVDDFVSIASQMPFMKTQSGPLTSRSPFIKVKTPSAWEVRSLWTPSSLQVSGNCLIAYALADGFVGLLPSYSNQEMKDVFGSVSRRKDAKMYSLCISEGSPPLATHVARLFTGPLSMNSEDGVTSKQSSVFLPQLAAHRVRGGLAQLKKSNICLIVTGGAEGKLRLRIIDIEKF